MKNKIVGKKIFVVVVLIGLLVGATYAGAVAFNGPSAMAQSADGDEGETPDAEDGGEGPDVPITGTALEQASAVALAYVGQGRVTGTEVGDEEGYYEVEITLENGRQVDVHLDEAFNVLGQETE
jgi:hypothetical protein